jgi:HEAT repeat protein
MKASIERSLVPLVLCTLTVLLLQGLGCAEPANMEKSAGDPIVVVETEVEEADAAEPEAKSVDVSGILKTAAIGSGEERYTAIDDLGEHHVDAASVVPVLVKLLGDSDKQVRWRAARALGDFREDAKPAVPQLIAMLSESDPVLEYHAAASLGKIGDKSDATVDALSSEIANPDSRVARTAIAALRNLQPDPERVMAALEQVLEHNDEAVVAYAIEAAVERGAKAAPALEAALQRPATAYIACAAIEQIGPDAAPTVPALVALLGDTKHSQLQIQVLLALASIGPAAASAVPQILPLLDYETDPTIPVAAAYALGKIGTSSQEIDLKLKSAIEKPNPFLQMVAAWSLAKIHPSDAAMKQQAMDKLHEGMKSDDPAMKSAAEMGIRSLEPAAEAPTETPASP